MFIENSVRRKLVSLLTPYLVQEPDVELKLGFLKSHGVAHNLTFDTSLFNVSESARVLFKEFTVERFSVWVTYWSADTFVIDVRGVNVVMELAEDRPISGEKTTHETGLDEKKRVVAELDPEGSALHDVLQKFSETNLSKNQKTSFLNLILDRCHLQMHDINVHVHFPFANDSCEISLGIKELNVGSLGTNGCILKSLIGVLISPLTNCSLSIDLKGLEVSLKKSNGNSCLISSVDLSAHMKFNHLQLVDCNLHIPELIFSANSGELAVVFVFYSLLFSEPNHSRNGRHLWNIASARIGSLISAPKFPLHQLVLMVCLWVRYVKTYKNLLVLVGYPEKDVMNIAMVKMSEIDKDSTLVKKQWMLLSEFEKKLPAEAITRARRIARYRAALGSELGENPDNALLADNHSKFYKRTILLIQLVWNIICRIFCSFVNLLSIIMWRKNRKNGVLRVVSEDFYAQCCFRVSVGLVSVAVSSLSLGESLMYGYQSSDVGSSFDKLRICVSANGLVVSHTTNVCEQYSMVSCGQLKVISSSFDKDALKNQKDPKVYLNKEIDDIERTVLKTEPASMFYFPGNSTALSVNETGGTICSVLQGFFDETWTNWKRSCKKFEENGVQYWDKPWMFCEIKRSVTNQSLKHVSCGFSKGSLMLGKVSILLEYSMISSYALLLGQIQTVYLWAQGNSANVLIHTPVSKEISQPLTWDERCKSFGGEVEKVILKMIPHKYFQMAVFIAGPLIRLSLRKDLLYGQCMKERHIAGQDEFHFVVAIHNIELGVWPTLSSGVVTSSDQKGLHGATQTSFLVKEHQTIIIPRADKEKFSGQENILLDTYIKANGLEAFFESAAESKKYRIALLNPTAVKLSLASEDIYFWDSAIIAVSANWQAVAAGISVCLYMDEMFVLSKVLIDIYTTMLSVVYRPSSFTGTTSQVLLRRERSGTKTENVPLIKTKCFCVVSGTFEISSLEIIMQNSRKSNTTENYAVIYDLISRRKMVMNDLPDYGTICFSQKLSLGFSFKERELEVNADLFGIRSIIFKDQSETWTSLDHFQVEDTLNSLSCFCEMSVSHFTSVLRLPNLHCFPNGITEASTHRLVMDITTNEIYIVGLLAKEILIGAHKLNKLDFSVVIENDFQRIDCQMKGGSFFLETTALDLFVKCYASYHHFLKNLVPLQPESLVTAAGRDMGVQNEHPSQVNQKRDQNMTWEKLENLKIVVSQFSFTLVAADETGGFREIQVEADFHLNFEDRNRKFSFDLSRLSILSQTLNEVAEQKSSEIQSPHFSTSWTSGLSSDSVPEDPVAFQSGNHSVPIDASCSSPHVSTSESPIENSGLKILHLSRENYILKRLAFSVTVERPVLEEGDRSQRLDQGWIGNGAISGLEISISLQEIQMVLAAFGSFPGGSSKETFNKVGNGYWSTYQESDRNLIGMPPDGAVVAIQDVDQHLYMTVDRIEGKYNLVGAIHYSLVGKRALFRVKHQNQKRWGSSALWFSLISLHASDSSGESLRLNYRKGSGFVDISGTSDDSEALWTTIPCNSYNEELEIKPESHSFSTRNTFYFVNKKIDRAVAFVDEIPEFVTKPGNLFKWKVFHNFSVGPDILLVDSSSGVSSSTSVHDNHVIQNNASERFGYLPQIDITVDKVIITMVYELPDTKETLPLLQASICTTEFVVQLQLSKVRVLSRLTFVLNYFDGQNNLWREFVDPVDLCVFYRSRFQVQASRISPHSVSVCFYARMKKFGVSISELSLDTLLLVIGTLNLAGPFAIKVSKILSNSCKDFQILSRLRVDRASALKVLVSKVQNFCGLDLLCHFYDNLEASVSSKQASTIFLRHLASMHQTSEASKFSIQLAQRGIYSTSPINLSLLEAGSLAWRTQIVSTQDSKTYPGPFLIVDITRKSEEGLSISVSPLMRIYNETKFSLELRFRRPQQEASEAASVILKAGDTIDESVAPFDAVNLSGDLKKALMSLSVGNFLLSFRPNITDDLASSTRPLFVEWSVDFKGRKSVHLSGVFDKVSYNVRKAFSIKPVRVLFNTAHCSLKYEDGQVADLYFFIQVIIREIPVIPPDNRGQASRARDSPVAVIEQEELFILPTFRIMNLLQAEIHVLLTDIEHGDTSGCRNIGNQATIPSGSTVDLYADPSAIYFFVTLTTFSSSSKPVNSGDCVRKLQKQKNTVAFLDVDLIFGGGKYFASLRLSHGNRGVMEVTIFTPYTLRNDTDLSLLCFASDQKSLSRDEVERLGFMIPLEAGSLLPPKSTKSWFMKHNKVRLKLVEEQASEVLLDLDALSGLAEIGLEAGGISGSKHIMRLGLTLGPLSSKVDISQVVTMVPRYVVSNESGETIIVRQFDLEDDQEGIIEIQSKQKAALRLRSQTAKKEISVFEKLVYKHRNTYDDSSTFIQFRQNEAGLDWSGPICVASLGRFFLKFRRSSDLPVKQSDNTTLSRSNMPEFAAVHVVEENSTLVLRFHKPPDVDLPYRIENNLHQRIITYYQKDSFDPEILGPGNTVDYVWDDLTRPRRLVVQIDGLNLRREINLDKVRGWKPFYRVSQHRGLGSHLPLDKNPENARKTNLSKPFGQQMGTFGYEIYADGATRVLRFSDFRASFKKDALCLSKRVRIKISSVALNLLQNAEQEMDVREAEVNAQILVGRIENISLVSMLTDKHIYNKMSVQALSVDQKWVGAPFAAMFRWHQSDSSSMNGDILHIVLVILSSSSIVRQIKYLSVVLQPVDINLDEETLMRLVPFWRTSLSDSKTPSTQYYFDHFEIHPVKIVANFLPGDSFSSYSSPQETLRTLLHSVIKIPAIKSKTIELNGVLVTHALITIKELFVKCAQHYSWYAMRAIYIAKGSPLLPPAFASIFDDLASSSLDAFFDPSSGLINVPGLTIGTFKLLSKCIDDKGFSGTKRYLGDLGKTIKKAGSNILFAAVTEISDSVLKGAEASGVNGMVSGFHQGVLKLAMEPSVLGAAFMEGGPDRKLMLDRSPGIDELYIEGYLQAMLDTTYKQEYLRVRVVDNQVFLKNLPPNSSLIEEIMDRVKSFLESKALLKGDPSSSQPLRHLRGHTEWKIGPTVVTLCEHLFVSFAIRFLRKQASKVIADMNLMAKFTSNDQKAIVPASPSKVGSKMKFAWKWGIGKFVFSGILAYIDGRLCRCIPHPVIRRIVSGFVLSFLESDDR